MFVHRPRRPDQVGLGDVHIVDPSAPTIGYTLTAAGADGSNGW